jgi:hypothetical protein
VPHSIGPSPYSPASYVESRRIYTVFLCLDILCATYLVFRSTSLAKTIGYCWRSTGLAYTVYGFADFVAAGVAQLVPLVPVASAPS